MEKIGIGVVAVLVVLVAVSFLLPRQVVIERDIVIDAPAQKVFPYLVEFEKFNTWSPWAAMDPKTVHEYVGTPGEVGSMMKWKSDVTGEGSQKLTESRPFEYARMELDFGQGGPSAAYYKVEAQGDKTHVVWGFDGDMGNNPIGRYMGLMMDSWLGKDYEAGLKSLKTVIEKG